MLWLLLRANRAVTFWVLAATHTLIWLWLILLPCGVEPLSLQVIISMLYCILMGQTPFPTAALKPPDWPTCGDVNTHSSEDAIGSAGGSNYLSSNWKWKEMLAVVSTYIRAQETERRLLFPSSLSFTYAYTLIHAELQLIYALAHRTVKSLLALDVCICVHIRLCVCVSVRLSGSFSVVLECHNPLHV